MSIVTWLKKKWQHPVWISCSKWQELRMGELILPSTKMKGYHEWWAFKWDSTGASPKWEGKASRLCSCFSSTTWNALWLLVVLTHLPVKAKLLVAQPCPTLCDPMDCSPPGFPVHGILQARTVEDPFSRGSSQPRDQTRVSHMAGRFFTIWAAREALILQLLFSHWVMSHSLWSHGLQTEKPGISVLYHLPEVAQTHVHQVSDAIQLSPPLSSPSPPAFNPPQH